MFFKEKTLNIGILSGWLSFEYEECIPVKTFWLDLDGIGQNMQSFDNYVEYELFFLQDLAVYLSIYVCCPQYV